MSKKHKPPSFTVFVDTNVIFPKDPSSIVGSKFMKSWKDCSTITKLTLIVPEVVRGERIYQMVAFAERLAKSVSDNLELINGLSGATIPELPSLKAIREGVEQKFDKWAKSLNATVASIPFEAMDWRKVANDAIWRLKPFEVSTQDKDSEKGFRDCLILETLAQVVRDTKDQQVVFISKDALLREAATERFDAKQLAAYEEMGGFASYLDAIKKQHNAEFAQAVIQKAPSVFYKLNDPECVYNKFNPGGVIIQKFGGLLATLTETFPHLPLEYTAPPTVSFYAAASDEKIYIDSTELGNVEADVFQWKTRLRFFRFFKKQNNSNQSSLLDWLGERIRIQSFEITWFARVNEEIEFWDLRLGEIQAGKQTVESGFDLRVKYGFVAPQTTPIQPY